MRATNLERKQLSQSPCFLIHRPSTVFAKQVTRKKMELIFKKSDSREVWE